MEELNDLVEKAQAAKRRSAYVNYVSANDILAIAEAFRALERRAEAAEEWVKTAERTMDYQASVITELGVRAEGAETKLAGLEKQEPSCNHHWIRSEGRTASGWLCSKCGDYDGPAPAADLAELVPDDFTTDEVPCAMTDVIQAEMDGWNACRAEILRKIEEVK